MVSGGGGAPSGRSRCRSWAKRCSTVAFKLAVYLWVAALCVTVSAWNWMYEQVSYDCQHKEPLPANNSGVKVLVYGLAKTGTTSMSKALYRLSLNVWKGPEIKQRLFAPIADEYWRSPQRGGGMFPLQRLATALPPANMEGTRKLRERPWWQAPSWEVLEKMPRIRELMAERLSKCHVEGVVFDGHENLFWPIYEVSPDARVVMLSWRRYRDHQKSAEAFDIRLKLQREFQGLLNVGMHVLPYQALVYPALDALTGNTLLSIASSGRSWFDDEDAMTMLYNHGISERRVIQHLKSGLSFRTHSERDYEAYWEEARRRIPKDRLLEFNMKKSTAKDLCDFLKVEGPACDPELLPNEKILLMSERNHPERILLVLPYFLLCHWTSYKVVHWVLRKVVGVVSPTLFRLLPPKGKRKLT